MREAVIVSYARTGLAKSGRGGFNITPPMSMAAHAIKHAVERAGVDKDYVEDSYIGNCAHGAPNIGRQAALLAGLPKSTAGVSVNRFCSSGLQTIAMAANSIRSDGSSRVPITVTIGSAALRSAWRQITSHSETPLARAVRT